MVKNLPAMQETWVRSLGWEDSWEEGMATHLSTPARRILMNRGAWSHGVAKDNKLFYSFRKRIKNFFFIVLACSQLWLLGNIRYLKDGLNDIYIYIYISERENIV